MQTIEISDTLLRKTRDTLISLGAKDEAIADINHALSGGYTYELKPTKEVPLDESPDAVVCDRVQAEQWSIYRRPINADEKGQRLATWVCDFGLQFEELAEITTENFNDYHQEKR